MTAYRRVSAVAVAALLVSGFAAPAAFAATPAQTPAAATQVAPSPETPVKDGLLRVDLSTGLDLDTHGVVVAAVDGALDASAVSSIEADAGVVLKVGAGSKIVHANGELTGGTIKLQGGLELGKGNKKIKISGLSVDVASGAIKATVGAKAGVTIGSVDLSDAEIAQTTQGKADAVVDFGGGAITLNSDLVAAVDADLATCLSTSVDLDAGVEVEADLATAVTIDADLAAFLDIDLDALLDLELDLGIHLL
ncbi:hypothetical protein ACFQVC_01940 [Streptomyces monticola]|uniref:Uncharacterized protein n=2 Tax=Streptomyces monticola TaxID=2666263 RepID=A0ABW2JAG7_9ACTN